MEKILYDWGEMCENNSSFERGYFFTLLMEDLNKEKVYEVCRYFPNSMKLIKIKWLGELGQRILQS